MNTIDKNMIAGVAVCDGILPDDRDFNRPVTRKLYETAKKLENVHAQRFIMAVPGFFTSALIDPIRRVLLVPVCVASVAGEDLHKLNDTIYALKQFAVSKEDRKKLKELQKEMAFKIVTLPLTYTLITGIGVVATTALAAADLVTSPIHTAWRVSKMK